MKHFNSFAEYLRQVYGCRVQKISINIPFSCPNRDGSKGTGGCIYCNNTSFLPEYTLQFGSVAQQLNDGISYFHKKYPTQLYIAYFQNYTNTYARLDKLRKFYYEAINHEKVVGLAISTRPDCITDKIIAVINEINRIKKVFVEIGIESTKNNTLKILNRCHTFEDVKNAVNLLRNHNIWITGHLIFGLPGESFDDIIFHAKNISELKLQSLKLHQLQILKNTPLHQLYKQEQISVKPLNLDEYIQWVIHFLEHISPDIYIERFTSESPPDTVIEPKWGKIKNYHVIELVRKKMSELKTYQGKNFKKL